jgi:lipoyl(octanoyl) transferase
LHVPHAAPQSVPAHAEARASVDWAISTTPVAYEDAVAAMEARVEAILAGVAPETVWLLEHPPLYTAGTSASPQELLQPSRFPVFTSGRGGRFTYHGPGQRVAYVMLDLNRRGRDARSFVHMLEHWLIAALARVGVHGAQRDGQIGVFVGGAKIASIGIRLRRWISFHGASLNVDPDLEHFSGIVPCGLTDALMTSLEALGATTDMSLVDDALHRTFEEVFGTKAVRANRLRSP